MKRILSVAALALSLAVTQAVTWQIDLYQGGLLTGANEAPPVVTPATGGEAGVGLLYDDATKTLSINLIYGMLGWAPLTGDFTGTHIHEAPYGFNGPVRINLAGMHFPIGTQSGIIQGNVTLTPALETALFSGNLYVNVHSTTFPGGEIRGQFLVIPEPGTYALFGLGLGGLWLWRRRKA